MTNERLTVEVEPELGQRIEAAAAAKGETAKDFIERAILRELRQENGATQSGGEETHPPESGRAAVRVGGEWDDGEDEELYFPPKGVKPKGSENPIKPKGGGNPVSDAVIEDRR